MLYLPPLLPSPRVIFIIIIIIVTITITITIIITITATSPPSPSRIHCHTAYCMNREPWFFRFTSFFSDRFHWYAQGRGGRRE